MRRAMSRRFEGPINTVEREPSRANDEADFVSATIIPIKIVQIEKPDPASIQSNRPKRRCGKVPRVANLIVDHGIAITRAASYEATF
jgi:hypothetical protein